MLDLPTNPEDINWPAEFTLRESRIINAIRGIFPELKEVCEGMDSVSWTELFNSANDYEEFLDYFHNKRNA